MEFSIILKHLGKSKDCKEKVDKEFLDELRKKSTERRKARKKEVKNMNESCENAFMREERLEKKRKYMKMQNSLSNVKSADVDEIRKKRRENKQQSRKRQKEFDLLKQTKGSFYFL